MNVLLLDLGMELRGGQRQVYYLARALAATPEFTALTACPAESHLGKLLREEGLPILALPGRSPLYPGIYRTLNKRLPPKTILHTHDANAATVGALCKLLRPDLTLIHSRRVSYPLRKGLRLWKYRMADAVVGVSREISEGFIHAGLETKKVATIHSGIEPSRYCPHVPHKGSFLFQSIGACTPQKGYSVLLQAIQRLQERAPAAEWHVRIVGDGPLYSSLLAEAKTLGIQKYLTMPGRLDSRDVLPSCDAMLVPSVDGEGSSGAIKEGWVTGVPVICSDLPSNTELVQHNENGLLVKTGDPDALAEAMLACLNSPELCTRLVAGGRATVANFTDQTMAQAYMQLYRRLQERPQHV